MSRPIALSGLMSIALQSHPASIRSNAWGKWRPWIILMECADFDFRDPRATAPVAYLLDLGYVLDGKINANVLLRDGRVA